MKTDEDLTGKVAKGTFNNCGNGRTPWGTYLACEENFHGYFSSPSNPSASIPPEQSRYGLKTQDKGYNWVMNQDRFDLVKNPNEVNRHGYITEIDPSKKTVLLYAHHDVQPVGDINKWNTDPFKPEVIDGRLFARGSGDNKAGVVTHYEVVKNLFETQPVNLKIFIEGEEEIGSPYMTEFIAENREDLEADVIVIADSGNIKSGVPTITTSLR